MSDRTETAWLLAAETGTAPHEQWHNFKSQLLCPRKILTYHNKTTTNKINWKSWFVVMGLKNREKSSKTKAQLFIMIINSQTILFIFNSPSIFFSSQAGIKEWTMSQELAVGNCFPRCTWRHVASHCLRWGSPWSFRPATSGRAVTGRPTRRNHYKNFVVGFLICLVFIYSALEAVHTFFRKNTGCSWRFSLSFNWGVKWDVRVVKMQPIENRYQSGELWQCWVIRCEINRRPGTFKHDDITARNIGIVHSAMLYVFFRFFG